MNSLFRAGTLALLTAPFAQASSIAQPAATFHATCGELRQAIIDHGIDASELTTIRVEGEITAIEGDGAVVYVLMCEPPDPYVLCVTYETNGNVAGDRVVIAGAYGPRDPDHIMLDPCLHGPVGRYAD